VALSYFHLRAIQKMFDGDGKAPESKLTPEERSKTKKAISFL